MNKCLLIILTLIPSFAAHAAPLTIATFNIRRDGSEAEETRAWRNRVPAVAGFLQEYHPAIIGFQEATAGQIADISRMLPYHEWVGIGRGSSWWGLAKDEAVPLFYDKTSIKLLDSGTFSLMPSKNWLKSWLKVTENGLVPRICTWGFFELKETGSRFYVFNLHLDHKYEKARLNQLKKLQEQMPQIVREKAPVFVMGDFNSDLTPSIAHELPDYANLRVKAAQVEGPAFTSTSWGSKLKRIDHILVKFGEQLYVAKYQVFEEKNRSYLSDHRPVMATIELW